MNKVAGVVVIYNSDLSLLDTLNTYIEQIEKLYVVDNSDKFDPVLVDKLKCLKKVDYIWNKSNLGIAFALNIGAKKAIEEGFEYLLTMDQDSKAPADMINNLLKGFSADNNIAIVSTMLKNSVGGKILNKFNEPYKQICTAWTSGNLIDLNIFEKTSGFKEDFFIDYVDHEFCLRLNKLGYKIYVCNNSCLLHNLGKIKEINFFCKKVYITNHSALRVFYKSRNHFYLRKIYKKDFPDFFKMADQVFWRSLFKAILFEKDKIKKIKFFILGFIAYKRNKFGKYTEK